MLASMEATSISFQNVIGKERFQPSYVVNTKYGGNTVSWSYAIIEADRTKA